VIADLPVDDTAYGTISLPPPLLLKPFGYRDALLRVPVFCVFCKKDHDICPTCHPDLVKAKIIALPSMTGRWPITAFTTQGIYEQACLSKEMLAASRLMSSE
jgi:hypothetical protein